MPISSQRKAGFGLSKWELNYLRCRYKAHRNKVATTGPAIDAETPMDRPHVRHKGKKALNERKRQIDVMQENLRILNRTAEIMSSVEIFETPGPNPHASPRCSRQRKTTAVSKRNAQLLFQWFIHKFGKYVPWWAHINY